MKIALINLKTMRWQWSQLTVPLIESLVLVQLQLKPLFDLLITDLRSMFRLNFQIRKITQAPTLYCEDDLPLWVSSE